MFPHCHNPIFHRANLSSLARALERAVVGHNTVLTVKLRWLSKKVYVVLLEDTDTLYRQQSYKPDLSEYPGWQSA